MALIYLTIEQAIEVHRKTVLVSGGGTIEHLDTGKLDAVLEHIQNDDYYPTIEDKLTHLFFSTNKFHCFADGNKRIAITLSTQFLLKNGYLFIAKDFIPKMENISYHVAAGKISKELLRKILGMLLDGTYDTDEEIKLDIYNAIME